MAANPQHGGFDPRALAANDADQQETREWLDALAAVIDKEGPERAHFLLEQLLFGQPAFKEGAGIDARGHVALDVEAVAAMRLALGVPEMVEAGTKQVGQGGKRADVAAKVGRRRGCGGWP